MSPVPIKYPLDGTGVSPGNLVRGEPKTLRDARIRVFVTNYGAFFSESLVVKDVASNRILTRNVDYFATEMYALPTERYGKEICAVVVVQDENCGSQITVDYQALGGEYSHSRDAIVQMIATLGLDNRPVQWGNLIDRPDGFDPSPHLHDVGDVYGFEYLVQAIDRLAQTILLGSAAGEGKIYSYIDRQVEALNAALELYTGGAVNKQIVVTALGYNPADVAGDTFDGTMLFNKGIVLNSYMKEAVRTITASQPQTTLDLSTGSIFLVNMQASSALKFDISKIENLEPNQSISFTVVVVNAVADRAMSFLDNIDWAGAQIPPRTTTLNGRDEYYFSTFNSGASYTGSMSNQDVK